MLQNNTGRYSPDLIALKYEETYNPRKGELERVFTKEELISLCMHKKCRVDMHRWNPIYEFYWQLKRKGRIQNKNPHKIQKLLIKLGNRYKNDSKRSYSLEEIEKERAWDWEMRKCFNVRWFDENKENCNKSTPDRRTSEDSFVTIIASQSPKSTDVHAVVPPTYMNHINYDPWEIVGNEEEVLDTENLDNTEHTEATEPSNDRNSLIQLEDAVAEIIASQSVSNILSESSPALLFDANSENYENFHVTIPMTSTQSQEDK